MAVDDGLPEEAAVPRLDEHVPGQRDRGTAASSGTRLSTTMCCALPGSAWSSTSVYQRKPRFLASTSTYQGSAIAARRRTLHHGTHGVSGRSPVSQKNRATTTSGASAPTMSFVIAARPSAAEKSTRPRRPRPLYAIAKPAHASV